ncbi:transcription factor 24 [Rhinatrema bivittatum]|uniref:transcription factor 24 n=1 Tax=Rhinatrema bivittatum TaxID=194408 RepID=UPI00112CE77D|nr:transcription factor 24 [Rhinatrema bivittatum]
MVEKAKSQLDGGRLPTLEETPCSPSAHSSGSQLDPLCSPGRRTSDPVAAACSPGHPEPPGGRPAAANAARERSRVQTLRQAFLELQKTLPSVPPDTKLSKLDVLILATTYIAHLTRSLQEEGAPRSEPGPGPEVLGALRGDGYLHPVKKWPMRSRLYIGATGQFLNQSEQPEDPDQGETSTKSQS